MVIIYFIFIAFSSVLANVQILGSWEAQMFFAAGCVTSHTLIELRILYKKKLPFFYVNPIVISSIVTMLLSLGGVTIFLMKYNDSIFLFLASRPLASEPIWLSKAISYSCLGSACMWLGFKLPAGERFFKWTYWQLKYKYILDKEINLIKVLFLTILAYGIKFYLFSIGRYGYQILSMGYEAEVLRLNTFENLSRLTFLLIYYLYKTRSRNTFITALLYVSIVLECLFSFIGGARSAIVYFFLSIAMVDSFFLNKFNYRLFLTGLGSLIFAFTLGNAIKEFVGGGGTLGNVDPLTAINLFFEQKDKLNTITIEKTSQDAWYEAIGRLNYVAETAMAIRYKETYGLQEEDPPFLESVVTAPFFAVIPRFFVLGNKDPSWGGWFNLKVLNSSGFSSIAFSPVGFLYLMGGGIGVAFGFFFYGILLRINYSILYIRNIASFLFFIVLLSFLHSFDTNVSFIFLSFVRYWLLFPIAYYIFLAKN